MDDITHVWLADLPKIHPLRNRPLGEIGAQVKSMTGDSFRSVETWKISPKCYNELDVVWTGYIAFRAPKLKEAQ